MTGRVEIGEIGSPKILALGVLPVPFLTIGFHFVDILLGILSNPWIVTVGADDNVLPVLKFRPGVRTAAAVTCEETSAPPISRGGCRGSIGGLTTACGITLHGELGLTGVGADDRVYLSPAGRRVAKEGLREANGLA